MSAERIALQKTQRDQDALVTVLMINQFFIYVFAFLEIVNNNLSYSTLISLCSTIIWVAAYLTDSTLFDFSCCKQT